MYGLFGFLGILLLLAGLLPIRVLPGFLRGRPRKERRAMWVSGLIIVLIAGAFTTEAPLATLGDAAPADATTIPSIESTTSTNASPTAPTATAAATTSTTGATSTTAAVTTTVAPTTTSTTTTSTTTTTTTTAAPTTTTIPPNPGDSKNCSDFSTHNEAQAWFDTYFRYYGDVARLDGNDDGVACESLL